jgi:hypothetical protein
MGYTTSFKLCVVVGLGQDVDTSALNFDLMQIARFQTQTGWTARTHSIVCVYGIQDVKWYDHEEDLLGLSSKYPQFLFMLRGAGDDPGDIWIKYFKDGQIQSECARISLPAFDEKKLKPSHQREPLRRKSVWEIPIEGSDE